MAEKPLNEKINSTQGMAYSMSTPTQVSIGR